MDDAVALATSDAVGVVHSYLSGPYFSGATSRIEPLRLLFVEPGSELLQPRRSALDGSCRVESPSLWAGDFLQGEFELELRAPALLEEFFHCCCSTEGIRVIVVDTLDVGSFRLEVALDGPVVEV